MKKILTVHVKFFRAEEHCEFMIVTRDLIVKHPVVQTLITPLYSEFVILIGREEELINLMKKSDYTKRIAEGDHHIDRTLIGMRGIIVAALHHFDPATVEAARSLLNRLEAFGSITRKAYEEETLDVNLLLGDLQSDEYAPKAAIVGLTPWIQELRTAETAFEQLLELRNTETARKPRGRIIDVRHEADAVYHRIADRIDAAATLADGSTTYDEFIAELNARITYFNSHAHQHARRDISVGEACVIEPLAVQLYTGRAVTPLPRAYYREEGKPTVELVFANDFTVTYKNNVDVGTADLILHGKGAYKGQKKTTFNISRTV
jgi:hypothetical protein